jgi:hypothetical protein
VTPLLAGLRRLRNSLHTRAALGLGPATLPIFILMPLGIALGPLGSGVLTAETLEHLDVVISIALATLGVFVGIAIGTKGSAVGRLLVASTVEGLITMAVVAAAFYVLINAWGLPLALPATLAAAALGISASASAAPATGDLDVPAHQVAARVADLDDVVPMIMGALVLPVVAAQGAELVNQVALTMVAGLGVGLAGWLLLEGSEGAERGVFVIGTLALLAGCAAYLGASPLLAGLVAGLVWARTPGRTDQIAAADLRKVQHPLVVLLVIIAGASMQPTLAGIWLAAPFVLFRLTGKLAGGWVASRLAPEVAPSDLGAYLIPPGVLGIAFILNVEQVAPDASVPLVFAVSAAAVTSELLAVILVPVRRPS